ncbi:DUF309 domain-containing protein [Gorillibacterium sp. sgz5001074]|uniref:DUF309 domain-containing protein n=1 Tax=Gorillibacterium sp. sgz5001074 TaxID=3446695 RepID=UPI003F67A6B8
MGLYPEAYVEFLVHFHGTRDYFECHELLEEYWKQETDPALKAVWHSLIQAAVSAYHERRGNLAGAVKMLEQSCERLSAADPGLAGLDREELLQRFRERIGHMKERQSLDAYSPFRDPELPIRDPQLLDRCRALCLSWGAVWNQPSALEDESLLHRHTLRDRSDVISERRRSMMMKMSRKQGGSPQ